MKPRTMGAFLRAACILVALAGAAVLFLTRRGLYNEGEVYYISRALPWLSLPCWAALVLFWRVTGNIGRDRSFCLENVRLMRGISALAFLDTAALAVLGLVLLLMGLIGLRILSYVFCIVILGSCIGVASLALSALVDRARAIQEENDFTV